MPSKTSIGAGARESLQGGACILVLGALAALWLHQVDDLPIEMVGAKSKDAVQETEPPVVEIASVGSERTAVPPGDPPASSEPEESPRLFDEIFHDLVELFGSHAGGEGGDQASEIAELVTEMLVLFPDAGERTLTRIAAMQTPWRSLGDTGAAMAKVGRVLIDFALQRLAAEPQLAADLPVLVGHLLDSMLASPEMAEFVAQVLVDRPYLGAQNEALLIELARQASGPLAFLAVPVRSLLLTVWENMQRTTGARVAADLLAWFADQNGGTLREAAMQRLLGSERYRDLVIEQLIVDQNVAGMQDAALHAAKQLPFPAAIAVLATLQSSSRQANLIGAYAWMSASNLDAMRSNYEECLADNIMPRHREALIAAVGNSGSGDRAALASARAAFDMDPEPRVRGVAFLALCNNASTQDVSDCLAVAMQDRNFAANYHLSYIVTGVRALARRDDRDVNLIDRVTKFLLSQASLATWDRKKLEAVRREYLPR